MHYAMSRGEDVLLNSSPDVKIYVSLSISIKYLYNMHVLFLILFVCHEGGTYGNWKQPLLSKFHHSTFLQIVLFRIVHFVIFTRFRCFHFYLYIPLNPSETIAVFSYLKPSHLRALCWFCPTPRKGTLIWYNRDTNYSIFYFSQLHL